MIIMMIMMMNEVWADHVMMVMIFVTMTRFTDHDCHPGDENRGWSLSLWWWAAGSQQGTSSELLTKSSRQRKLINHNYKDKYFSRIGGDHHHHHLLNWKLSKGEQDVDPHRQHRGEEDHRPFWRCHCTAPGIYHHHPLAKNSKWERKVRKMQFSLNEEQGRDIFFPHDLNIKACLVGLRLLKSSF